MYIIISFLSSASQYISVLFTKYLWILKKMRITTKKFKKVKISVFMIRSPYTGLNSNFTVSSFDQSVSHWILLNHLLHSLLIEVVRAHIYFPPFLKFCQKACCIPQNRANVTSLLAHTKQTLPSLYRLNRYCCLFDYHRQELHN